MDDNSGVYLGLALIRCPGDIADSSYNAWVNDNTGNPSFYNIPLTHPLPFEYLITYEPFTSTTRVGFWQGSKGFSTNISLMKPL